MHEDKSEIFPAWTIPDFSDYDRKRTQAWFINHKNKSALTTEIHNP